MSRHQPPPLILPDWPALMGLDLAMAYTQLTESSFRFIARRRGVQPVDLDGLAVARWRRADLDRMVDSLPARGAPRPDADTPGPEAANDPPDPAAAALERARKRSRGKR